MPVGFALPEDAVEWVRTWYDDSSEGVSSRGRGRVHAARFAGPSEAVDSKKSGGGGVRRSTSGGAAHLASVVLVVVAGVDMRMAGLEFGGDDRTVVVWDMLSVRFVHFQNISLGETIA